MKNLLKRTPFVAQHDTMDCGPACLAMISQYYGKCHTLQFLRDNAYLTREGVSLVGLTDAANSIGFDSAALKVTIEELDKKEIYPSILYWNASHFVVLFSITHSLLNGHRTFHIADPSVGLIDVTEENLRNSWVGDDGKGVLFVPMPTARFFEMAQEKEDSSDYRYLFSYFTPYVKNFAKLAICLAASCILTLIFPFLTQALIDNGVTEGNTSVVTMILIAQLSVYMGSAIIEVVRNWIVLYIGARINIDIISDFFTKIMKLPFRFFDTKFTGDFYQRVQDHARIEQFLTSQTLTTLFSIASFSVFFVVLLNYDLYILCVYLSLTIVSVVWSRYFLQKREMLDYFRFKNNAQNQEAISEMIYGIQDVKLNDFEEFKIGKWRKIQIETFGVNLKTLKIDQFQLTGFEFINQVKNILVSYIAAQSVIDGNMTLGGMMTVSYIIGQMNSPVSQLVSFFRSFQDARISMRRLAEVQNMAEEGENSDKLSPMPSPRDIKLQSLSFQYEGPSSPFVLHDVNIYIPAGKMTAIVGSSGSGKTTLMRLLLKFYEPSMGSVLVEGIPLLNISPKEWRNQCGVVMQDGYIFSETIARNIATSEESIDRNRLEEALKIANIKDYVDSLPQKENTMIGSMGNGISGGQRQRLLIARAVYKRPNYIFFDEATSSLDTENENLIQKRLKDFFKDRTVVVIAHRLSTVKNADQIIVLQEGRVVEIGSHQQLIKSNGAYYRLVKNQIELENS